MTAAEFQAAVLALAGELDSVVLTFFGLLVAIRFMNWVVESMAEAMSDDYGD